jgi:hypothetical protein
MTNRRKSRRAAADLARFSRPRAPAKDSCVPEVGRQSIVADAAQGGAS